MTTTNENILPDDLQPRAHDRHHDRPESYWTERNALVSAIKACPLPSGDRCYVAYDQRSTEEQAQWDAYGRALEALKAFDAAHGGSPIL